MNCWEARRALSTKLDGEFGPEKARHLEDHVRECPACAEAARAWEEIRAGFEHLPRPSAPRGLAERVLERIRATQERLQSTRPLLRLAAVAAGILLVVTSTVILITPPPVTEASGDPTAVLAPDRAIDRMMTEIVRDYAPTVGPGEVSR